MAFDTWGTAQSIKKRGGELIDTVQGQTDYRADDGGDERRRQLLELIHARAMGTGGPSVAQTQLQAGQDAAAARARSMAAGARGDNVALAQREAQRAQWALAAGAAHQNAELRAKEQIAAIGAEQSAMLEGQRINAGIAEGNAERGQKGIGGIIGAAGSLFAMSDETAKEPATDNWWDTAEQPGESAGYQRKKSEGGMLDSIPIVGNLIGGLSDQRAKIASRTELRDAMMRHDDAQPESENLPGVGDGRIDPATLFAEQDIDDPDTSDPAAMFAHPMQRQSNRGRSADMFAANGADRLGNQNTLTGRKGAVGARDVAGTLRGNLDGSVRDPGEARAALGVESAGQKTAALTAAGDKMNGYADALERGAPRGAAPAKGGKPDDDGKAATMAAMEKLAASFGGGDSRYVRAQGFQRLQPQYDPFENEPQFGSDIGMKGPPSDEDAKQPWWHDAAETAREYLPAYLMPRPAPTSEEAEQYARGALSEAEQARAERDAQLNANAAEANRQGRALEDDDANELAAQYAEDHPIETRENRARAATEAARTLHEANGPGEARKARLERSRDEYETEAARQAYGREQEAAADARQIARLDSFVDDEQDAAEAARRRAVALEAYGNPESDERAKMSAEQIAAEYSPEAAARARYSPEAVEAERKRARKPKPKDGKPKASEPKLDFEREAVAAQAAPAGTVAIQRPFTPEQSRRSLAPLEPYRKWTYRPEDAARQAQAYGQGDPEQTWDAYQDLREPRDGIMAQDLERSKEGRRVVSKGPTGKKMLDRDKALSFSLAELAGLDKRMREIEDGIVYPVVHPPDRDALDKASGLKPERALTRPVLTPEDAARLREALERGKRGAPAKGPRA